MPGTPIQALWQWSGPHAAAKVYLFCRFRFTLMAFRGETGHTGPTEGNTTAPLCKGVPIRAVFGSPLMAFRGETGHTESTEGNTTAPLCTIRKCGELLTFASCCIWKSIYESHTAGSGKDEKPTARDLHCHLVVRAGGLEPPRLAAPDPKSGLATNYNTPAILMGRKDSIFC